MKIGIAGTGTMGSAIARRLMQVGRSVTVWNRSAEKTAPLASEGAQVAKTAAALAGECDLIITILTNAAAIEAVYLGAEGLKDAHDAATANKHLAFIACAYGRLAECETDFHSARRP